jgi:hypothetical protein
VGQKISTIPDEDGGDQSHATSAMDGNSGGCKGSKGMGEKDKYEDAGMQQLKNYQPSSNHVSSIWVSSRQEFYYSMN